MRAPQPRGTPINTPRLRRWVHNFATYRHQISEQSVNDWLDQFEDGHRDTAARILDVVDFYSADRISGAFKAALATLPGWHESAEKRNGKWRFAGISRSAGESADAMMHRFRIANGLDGRRFNELFIHPSDILLQGLDQEDTLVLVDDFIGTGDSVCATWKESFAELVVGVGKIYLVVVAALESGRQRIADETSMSCVVGQELTAGDNFFGAQCAAFSNDEKQIMLAYCEKANNKEPKGYKECGLLLTFQHRCPNNSIPILHAENRRWTGLFPRHS